MHTKALGKTFCVDVEKRLGYVYGSLREERAYQMHLGRVQQPKEFNDGTVYKPREGRPAVLVAIATRTRR